MTSTRSETRTADGWHSFDRVAGLVSLFLAVLLLLISLARGSLGDSSADQVAAQVAPSRTPDSAVRAESGGARAPIRAPDPAQAGRAGDAAPTASPDVVADSRRPAAPPTGDSSTSTVDRIPVRPDPGSASTPAGDRRSVSSSDSGLVRPILDIRASEGKLTIDGIIGDEPTRQAILQAALSRFGMRNINDRLAVSAGVARFDWTGAPDEIIALVGDPSMPTSIKVDGNAITLSGNLPDLADKEARSLAAQQLFGPTARVTNRIQIGTSPGNPVDRLSAANSRAAVISADGRIPAAGSGSSGKGNDSRGTDIARPSNAAAVDAPAAPQTAAADANAAPGTADQPGVTNPDTAMAQAVDSEAGEPAEDGALVLTLDTPPPFKLSECARVATGITIPFRSGSAELTGDVQAALKAIAPCFERREYIVGGHTDGRGSDVGNLILSQARAEMVVEFLKGLGVPEGQLTVRGYGESRPVATNQTEEGRVRNRRVDFRFAK